MQKFALQLSQQSLSCHSWRYKWPLPSTLPSSRLEDILPSPSILRYCIHRLIRYISKYRQVNEGIFHLFRVSCLIKIQFCSPVNDSLKFRLWETQPFPSVSGIIGASSLCKEASIFCCHQDSYDSWRVGTQSRLTSTRHISVSLVWASSSWVQSEFGLLDAVRSNHSWW